jgi:hypothetical protein
MRCSKQPPGRYRSARPSPVERKLTLRAEQQLQNSHPATAEIRTPPLLFVTRLAPTPQPSRRSYVLPIGPHILFEACVPSCSSAYPGIDILNAEAVAEGLALQRHLPRGSTRVSRVRTNFIARSRFVRREDSDARDAGSTRAGAGVTVVLAA